MQYVLKSVCTIYVNLSENIKLQSRTSDYFFMKVLGCENSVRSPTKPEQGREQAIAGTVSREEAAGSFSGDHSSGLFL